MTLNIKDFDDRTLSMEDFEGQEKLGPILNDKTSSSQAATTVTLTGDGLDKYKEVKEKVSDPDTRQEVLSIQDKVREQKFESAKPAIGGILADPDIPDEVKMRVAQSVTTEGNTANEGTMKMLAEQIAVSDPGPDATAQTENSTDKVLDTLDIALEHRRRMQAIVNGIKGSRDITTPNMLVDVGELIVPFAEWIHFSDLQREILNETGDEGKALVLGQQKQKIFESLQGMTLEERSKVARTLARIVEENSQILLPDGNDLMMIETLQRMLVDNDYSDFERWFDNVTSVADLIGLGGIVRYGGKSLKGGKAAIELEEFAAETVESGEEFISAAEKARRSRTINTDDTVIEGSAVDVSEQAITTEERKLLSSTVSDDVDPASPGAIANETNPNIARGLQETALSDETEEASIAIYGTNKSEAINSNMGPKADNGTGNIPHRPEMNAPRIGEPEHVRSVRLAEGNTLLSDNEWHSLVARITQRFQDVGGMHLHKGSLLVRTLDNGHIGITGRYSPVDSGFTTSEQALSNAEYHFRNFGLKRDNFQLLVRSPSGEWVRESAQDASARQALVDKGALDFEKEYSIGIDYNYSFRPEDMEIEELLTSGTGLIGRLVNFADRIPSQVLANSGQGSLVQNLLDPASIIHPRIVNAASVSTDKAFRMRHLYTEVFGKFTDAYKKLNKSRRAVVSEYINKANFEGIPLKEHDLVQRGFNSKEIALLKEWRLANDVMWYAANEDLVASLRTRGYKVLVHKDSDTLLIGRPIANQNAPKGEFAFDPMTGLNKTIDKELIDSFKEGQSLVELKEPIQIDGEWVKYSVNWDNPQNGFIRELADDEIVMSYREGYYPVMYDANYFVDKVITLKGGSKEFKTIASARDSKELAKLKEQVMVSEGITEQEFNKLYKVRGDNRTQRAKNELLDEGSFNLSSNSNLSMQRVRGERLADAGVDLHLRGMSNLVDPLEAVAEQIRIMSRRVSLRKYLDTAKKRWMLTYGDQLDLPLSKAREPEFPKSITQVKGKQGSDPAMVSDARTNFNYLYSFENGYINLIDEGFKTSLQAVAQVVGEAGGPAKLEKMFFDLSKMSPTHSAKSLAFRLYLSSSPLRQALVQRSQISQWAIYNPTYMSNPAGLMRDLTRLNSARVGMKVNKDTKDLLEEVKSLGILQAVDAHTLIRDDYLKLADLSAAQKVGSVVRKPLDFMQQIGFDLAEQDVLMSSYLTFRDLAVKEGKDLKSQRVREQVLGQARAAALNMNRSGDVAHSHNTLAPITQFLSFQHKMFIQTISNKNLKNSDRLKLLAFNTLVFGVGATPLYFAYDKIWGDSDPTPEKEFLKHGMIDQLANLGLSQIYEDTNIDFSDIAPIEAYGMTDIFVTLAGTPLSGMLAESPAGSLFFGGNARLQEAAKSVMRYFVPMTDYEDPLLKTTEMDVVKSAAHMFSGYSSFFKAKYAFETGTAMSSSGKTADSDVNPIEAISMLLGMTTKDVKAQWEIYNLSSKGSNRFFQDDDVVQWYKDLRRHVSRRGTEKPEDIAYRKAVLGEAWKVFGQDRPRAIELIQKELQKDLANGDDSMYKHLWNKAGLIEHDEWMRMLNALPDTEMRAKILELYKDQREKIKNINENLETINGRIWE